MANMLTKPKLFLPTTIAAAIMGAISTLLNIKGTPFSAGFGFSGLIGPLTAFNEAGKTGMAMLNVIIVFVVLPIILALGMKWLFMTKINMIKPGDLKLTLK